MHHHFFATMIDHYELRLEDPRLTRAARTLVSLSLEYYRQMYMLSLKSKTL